MSASPVSPESAAPVTKPLPPENGKPAASSHDSVGWKKYVTPLLVVALALAVLITITRDWNAWEGGKVEQVTDDAYVLAGRYVKGIAGDNPNAVTAAAPRFRMLRRSIRLGLLFIMVDLVLPHS